ncbi:hypothetical protein B0H10DRAFT_2221077 [Mycena sp. CBHHK59/15]|nr:hypothetical protein B0H10DRAFT_2221077 [Mycena sp. CBHHK59/15]
MQVPKVSYGGRHPYAYQEYVDALLFASVDLSAEMQVQAQQQGHMNNCRWMSVDSVPELPSSAVSHTLYADSYASTGSSQFSVEFLFSCFPVVGYNDNENNNGNDGNGNGGWQAICADAAVPGGMQFALGMFMHLLMLPMPEDMLMDFFIRQ